MADEAEELPEEAEGAPEGEPEAAAVAEAPQPLEGEAAEGGEPQDEPDQDAAAPPEEVPESAPEDQHVQFDAAEGEDEAEAEAEADQPEADVVQIASSIAVMESLLEFQEPEPEMMMPTQSAPEISASQRLFETKLLEEKKHAHRVKSALGSVIDIRTGSVEAGDKKTVRYANTYKLESENPFSVEKVDKILESVMTEAFENLTYEREKVVKQVKWASTSIRAKVKELEFDRYKIICVVTIGEKNSQDVFVACRFLWDAEKDRYSFFSLENTYVYGIAMCFGLYYE